MLRGSKMLSAFTDLHQGIHAQHGMAHLSQVVEQLFGILGADGLIGDHVGEVLNAVIDDLKGMALYGYENAPTIIEAEEGD